MEGKVEMFGKDTELIEQINILLVMKVLALVWGRMFYFHGY